MSLSAQFLPAFLVLIQELSENDLLAEKFGPDSGCDGYPGGHDDELIRRALIKHTGSMSWPLSPATGWLTDADICALVEFFYVYVSKPADSFYHPFCRENHPITFDARAGHYLYTVEVNQLFGRFSPQHRLQSGRITRSSSIVLDTSLHDALPYRGDNHLQGLIQGAITDFALNDIRRKLQAVQNLAHALERVKTILEPGKNRKRESVAALIQVMASSEQLQAQLDAILREMTDLSNNLAVRHHEVGTPEINNDVVLIEFLFYSYYNLIRFALLKIGTDESLAVNHA